MYRTATVGLDFGTGSARALIVDTATGHAIGEKVVNYRRGVRDSAHSQRCELPPQWVIQEPADFTDAARDLLRWVAIFASESDCDIPAIGVTATSCTVLPTQADGEPLLHSDEFSDDLHAYVKLWKHHAAYPYAAQISASGESFLQRYSSKTSAEWSLAKALQTMEEAPRLWAKTVRWIDVADWLVWRLTGVESRSASIAGCKNHWQPDAGGYPTASSLERIYDGASSWLDKLSAPMPLGTVAGQLTTAWRNEVGLRSAPMVSVGIVDAQAAVLGSDVCDPGTLVVVAGTSTCHVSLSSEAALVPGVESVVYGGAINGQYDYVTGQPATGDMLAWFTSLLGHYGGTPQSGIFASLNEALRSSQGPSPVQVIDWWSGNRTPLARPDLRGSIRELSITSTADEIYRAMVESSAMGVRAALELHRQAGRIERIRFTGGLAAYPEIMQVYADVLSEPLHVHPCQQGSARGAALWAANAIGQAIAYEPDCTVYDPVEPHRYDASYRHYCGYAAE